MTEVACRALGVNFKALRRAGVQLSGPRRERAPDGPLTGKVVVVTGSIEGYSRDSIREHLEGLGAKVTDSVSSKTTGVIVGEEPGSSKLTKAQRSGVPLLSEQDLLELLSR